MRYNNVLWTMAALALLLTAGASALTINSPLDGEEYTDTVLVNISENGTADRLWFSVEGFTRACVNCSSIVDELTLENGTHTLTASSVVGNVSENETVTFTVIAPVNQTEQNETETNETDEYVAIDLDIESPSAGEHEDVAVLRFVANKPVDMRYTIDGSSVDACLDCELYEENRSLDEGNYTLVVFASDENTTVNASVSFSISESEENETGDDGSDDNRTEDGNATPRFAIGYNQLPRMLENGEVSDAELAQILREESLNPGVINRLVKTGLLGNESIDAIIEHQRTPPGIFGKVLGWFGFSVKTAKDELVEQYDLTTEQSAALLTDEDVSSETTARLQERVEKQSRAQERGAAADAARERKELRSQERTDERGTPGKSAARGQSVDRADVEDSSLPPGRAKKSFDAGGQRGGNGNAGGNGNGRGR